MHAILITFDQAHYERIVDTLTRLSCRGFTAVETVKGRGSIDGEPHYGSHAWPSMASAIVTVVPDTQRLDAVMEALRAIDADRPLLGLRAWAWPVSHAL